MSSGVTTTNYQGVPISDSVASTIRENDEKIAAAATAIDQTKDAASRIEQQLRDNANTLVILNRDIKKIEGSNTNLKIVLCILAVAAVVGSGLILRRYL